MMYYDRDGETESLLLPGPLKTPLTFMVSRVQCMEQEAGLVEDRYCSSQTRPEDHSRTCNTHACPAWWWSGPWQSCSVTCGGEGIRRRTVICVRSFGPTEQMALLDSACDQSGKPHETEPCPSQAPCVQLLEWKVGPWSKSCGEDPCEYEEREVECVAPSGACDSFSQPPHRRQCGNITCGAWQAGNWSKCSAPCGEGVQFRRVWCEDGLACREKDEPRSVRECTASVTTTTVPPTTSITTTTTSTSPTSTQSIITSSTTSAPPSPTTAITSPLLHSTTSDSASTIREISSPNPHEQSTATTSAPATTIPDATPTSTTTPLTIIPSPAAAEGIKSHPTPFPTNDDPLNSTFTSALPLDLSTDSVTTVLPTTQSSTTVSLSKDRTSAVTEVSLRQGPATSSSVPPPPALAPPSTPTEATTDHTSWPTRVPHPLDPDTPDSAELMPPSPDATHQEEATTVSEAAGGQDATHTPASEINNGTVTPEGMSSTTATPDVALGGVQLESKESASPSEPPRSSHVISETLNEIDLDSKPQVSKDKTLPDLKSYQGDDATHPQVTSATEDRPKQTSPSMPLTTEATRTADDSSIEKAAIETDTPAGMAPPTSQAEPATPEELATAAPSAGTDQPTVLEEPVKKKHTEEETKAPMLEEPMGVVMLGNDTDAQEEERPQGIAVDKIDVEDFEVIEIVELPPKGKKKKIRKKVLLHTGAEAVDALHNLAEETAERATPGPMPGTAGNTVVPQHRWSVGSCLSFPNLFTHEYIFPSYFHCPTASAASSPAGGGAEVGGKKNIAKLKPNQTLTKEEKGVKVYRRKGGERKMMNSSRGFVWSFCILLFLCPELLVSPEGSRVPYVVFLAVYGPPSLKDGSKRGRS
ncbi:A disintegrin and metalloproteinase with thrombospondin motifs 7 [Portunus trituberculatus]|uniref:A disintegrin and metalloproteinase with thrombospondin motifs 7 n=1 Tax=Portunus trituberculatus TaxID=210409 RepID=A0A5B7EIA8_PORTR|nr:A disintegrin and metalloproteinase with thrombospondin motifs 7 [Portunus trituberculatus]